MATWNNDTSTSRNMHEEPQTLLSNLTMNYLNVEEQLHTNGDHGSPTFPGAQRNAEEELEKIRSLLESNIEVLGLLIVKVYQYSNRPTQDGQCSTRKNRSLKELEIEFQLKMEQLKQAVAALSSTEPPMYFSVENLYNLIREIKNEDWIHLMRNLHVDKSEMEACSRLYPNLREQKYQMLKIWLSKAKDGMKTHQDQLVKALERIEYNHLTSMFAATSNYRWSSPP